jgi:uncharacterized membrane protein YqjE
MDTLPETDVNLSGAVKRVLWRLMAISHNRLELLMVEMQEERARAQAIVFLSAGVAVCGMLAVLMVTAVIACAFASHLLLALGILAAFYCIGAAFFYVKLSRMLQRWDTFTGSREQFDRDRECLGKKVT